MGRLFEVIPAGKLKNLDTWTYSGSAPKWIDTVIMNPFWEFVASLMPRWLAPNLITLAGNSMNTVACVLALTWCPDLVCAGPRWLYFLLPLLNFLWQTLDAVDGKHARNTGSSSPLGCLFDHGLDGLTWSQYFVPLVGAMQWGLGTRDMLVFFVLTTWLTYTGYWSARYSGCLMWEGTESQLIVMGLYLVIGIMGPEILLWGFDDVLNVKTAILVGGLFGPVRASMSQFVAVYRNTKKPEGALRELVYASILYVCFGFIFANMNKIAPNVEIFPLVFACFNLTTSHIINKSIVYDVTQMASDRFEWLVIPVGFVVYALHSWEAGSGAIFQVFIAYLVLVLLVWLRFVYAAITQICNHLHISLFTIRLTEKDD